MKGKLAIELHPLRDLHLTAKSPFEMKSGGTEQVVVICAGLSILLILIAGFNFINMTVAQSAKRAKEVGVRKALGASKTQLVTQFLAESVLVSLLSMIIACVLVELFLPSFNQLVDRALFIDYMSMFSVVILGVAIAVGIGAGLYPALFISSFSAKRVLSGDLQRGNTAIFVRKSLLTFQAALSIALIIASVTLQQQLRHLQSLPLGYETEQRVVVSDIPASFIFSKEPTALVNRLTAIDGVEALNLIDTKLTVSINSSVSPTWPNGEQSEGITPTIGVGYNLVEGLGLTLLAGRDFSRTYAADWASQNGNSTNVGAIITETVAKQAGYSNYQDIIGQTILDKGLGLNMRVVGVVADVKVGNAQDANSNIIFLCGFSQSTVGEIIMTVNTQNIGYVQEQVTDILAKNANLYEPNISLMSDNYKAVLRGDERVSLVVLIFTGSCGIPDMLGDFWSSILCNDSSPKRSGCAQSSRCITVKHCEYLSKRVPDFGGSQYRHRLSGNLLACW